MAGGRTLTRQEVRVRIASKVEGYRRRSVRCEERAERTVMPRARQGYRQSAQVWLRLAALHDTSHGPLRPRIDLPDLD